MSKLARRRSAADAARIHFLRSQPIVGRAALAMLALAAGIAAIGGLAAPQGARAQGVPSLEARVVAVNIAGASALAQVGTFLNVPPPGACANPIPSKFASYIQPGAMLDPKRILVGSTSNFGAPLAVGVGRQGSFLSIDPNGATLSVPSGFASSGVQASALGGAVQMFSANSPNWRNSVNNPLPSRNNIPVSAIRSACPTTTALAASGRRTHRLATAGSVRPRSSTRPGCR